MTIKSCFKATKHKQKKIKLQNIYKNEVRKHFKDTEYDGNPSNLNAE